MSSRRWRTIEELFHAALQYQPDQRQAFLREACEGDEALKHSVEMFLAYDDSSEKPVGLYPETLRHCVTASLPLGVNLGSYRIEEHLGTGGMGVVYRATDSKLGRSVALKMMHPESFTGEEGLRRFEREARALASFNHPNVAGIYGIEEFGGTKYLVLEYVPGSTLAERLKRGRLPVRDAMLIGKQISEALEAAHTKGIIHRDLKPANIKVSEHGQVKVLDFGLAKSVERFSAADGSENDDSALDPVSRSMIILGTAAYMSPEQASGTRLDSRTDIWSFGCVMYEMLSGKQAFRGNTLTEILAAVMKSEPDWAALLSCTPPAVHQMVRRCLRKEATSRLRDIGDARIELEDALASAPSPKRAGMTRRTAISTFAGATAGAAGTGIFAISRYRGGTRRNLTKFTIPAADGDFIPASANRKVAISPKGTHLAFGTVHRGAGTLYLRSFSDLRARPALNRESGGIPFFSPDNLWLGYFQVFFAGVAVTTGEVGKLRKIGLEGGPPITICTFESPAGATWAADNTIYFVATIPGGITGVPAEGGRSREVAAIDVARGERMHKFPHALPDANAVLFTIATSDSESFDDANIAAFSPASGQRKILIEGGTHPRYSPSGHLLYARNGSIMAVRFDPNRLRVLGHPFVAVEGVLMSRVTGEAEFDVSAGGDLVYIPGMAEKGERSLVWVDRSGNAESLALPPRSYLHPRIAPDGVRLAVEIEGANHDCYVYDFARGVLSKMTTDGYSHWPVWSPDGSQLLYRSGPMPRSRMWQVPADRSRAPQQVQAVGYAQNAESWSPDGHTIAYTANTPGAPPTVMVMSLRGELTPRPLAGTNFSEGSAKFSPDGHWLAYCTNESGKPEVYVQACPGPGPRIQVSTDGGADPVWSRNSGELFYRNGDSMMAVPVSTTPTFKAGRPRELWKGHYSHGLSSSCGPAGPTSSNYDVSPDGNRFLMVKDDQGDQAISREIVVVLGWADELTRMSVNI